MRIKISEQLERRIDRVYQLAGYSRKGDLIREATRSRLDELEAKYQPQEPSVRDAFSYTIDRGGVGGPEIRLTPNPEYPVRFEYVYIGDPPHTTILDTGKAFVPEETLDRSGIPGIKDTLEEIDGVKRVDVLTEGAISVKAAENAPFPVVEAEGEDPLVDRVYDALEKLIKEANQRVRDRELTREEARHQATKDYV